MVNRKRKGQVQLGETIAVVVIVIILLIIGIAFWGRISRSNVDEIEEQSQQLSVIEIANLISEMPELKCYESAVGKVKCLDLYKIMALKDSMEDPQIFNYYNDYFANSKITIMTLYPTPIEGRESITIYDAKLNNNTRTLHISIPVNIEDDVNHVTSYGMILVEGYFVSG